MVGDVHREEGSMRLTVMDRVCTRGVNCTLVFLADGRRVARVL